MYLTISHPEVVHELKHLPTGLWATSHGLVVKASKEVILTAKVNGGFRFYLAPVILGGEASITLVSAFFDDADAPLTVSTPLVRDEPATSTLVALLREEQFNVFFFDSIGRELLSVRVVSNFSALHDRYKGVSLTRFADHREALNQTQFWFSTRTPEDDETAAKVKIVKELFPSDVFIMDLEPVRNSFHGSRSFSSTTLVREEPGSFQEADIAFLFQRVFEPQQIYLNPVKVLDRKELADVLVVGETCALVVQAKDSPTTECQLNSSLERKRRKSISQMREAAGQLKGALSFMARSPKLELELLGKRTQLDLTGKSLIGVIVVREMFMDTMGEYSAIVFELMNEVKKNCVAFDYPELAVMTHHCPNEGLYLGAVKQILDAAHELGELPRLRYGATV